MSRTEDTALERIRAVIRADLDADAGIAFTRLAARYLADAAAGAGAVSPQPRSDAAADARFRPPAQGAPLDEVLEELGRVAVDGANRLWHPMYLGHQVAPPLPAAVWAEPVVAALNQSLAVREMSPAATAIELGLVRWMCGLVWGEATAAGAGGTFTSGGTEAIFTSLLAARNAALPDAAVDGMRGPAAIVCGEHAHYAVRRASGQLGLGSRGAVSVATTDGRMDITDLARVLDRLEGNGVPVVAVVATAGSTATGAFDPLEAIADVCDRRGLWLHVDAAHGGSALLSAQHRARLRGIAGARSVSWDAHKMMLMPLSAGVVLVRERAQLDGAFTQDAPYLFAAAAGREARAGGAEDGGTPGAEGTARRTGATNGDQGLRSFMCSRRADAVKVWVALRRYGVEGMAALYDGLCDRAQELHALLEAHPAFETLHDPECNIVCFRHVGSPRLPDNELDEHNLALRERLNASGEAWITTTLLDGKRVLRVVVMNPLTDAGHLGRLVDALAGMAAMSSFATPNRAP